MYIQYQCKWKHWIVSRYIYLTYIIIHLQSEAGCQANLRVGLRDFYTWAAYDPVLSVYRSSMELISGYAVGLGCL